LSSPDSSINTVLRFKRSLSNLQAHLLRISSRRIGIASIVANSRAASSGVECNSFSPPSLPTSTARKEAFATPNGALRALAPKARALPQQFASPSKTSDSRIDHSNRVYAHVTLHLAHWKN
jgi:hypothetical protein